MVDLRASETRLWYVQTLRTTLTRVSQCRRRGIVDTIKTTTPLLNKRLLNWLTSSYVFYKAGPAAADALGIDQPQGIGYGIGLAFGLFAMQGMKACRVPTGTLLYSPCSNLHLCRGCQFGK